MAYKSIFLRNGALLVEKYSGTVDIEDIYKNGLQIYDKPLPANEKFLTLTDLSEATFPNITPEEVKSLYTILDENTLKSNGMKNAIYTGNIGFQDFQKAYQFADEASNRPMSIITFSFLDLACDWLGITETERTQVTDFLKH